MKATTDITDEHLLLLLDICTTGGHIEHRRGRVHPLSEVHQVAAGEVVYITYRWLLDCMKSIAKCGGLGGDWRWIVLLSNIEFFTWAEGGVVLVDGAPGYGEPEIAASLSLSDSLKYHLSFDWVTSGYPSF